MPFLKDLNSSSHTTHLVLTAAATALATCSILSIYQSFTRKKRRALLADDINRSLAAGTTSTRIQPSPSSLFPQPASTASSSQPTSDIHYAEQLVREQL